jgi:hypothetical protein
MNMQNHFGFVSSFEHVNFAINGKYSKTFYDNSNLNWNVVLKSVLIEANQTIICGFECVSKNKNGWFKKFTSYLVYNKT